NRGHTLGRDVGYRQNDSSAHTETDQLSLGDLQLIQQFEDVARMRAEGIVWKLAGGSTKAGQIGNDHTEAGGERPRHAPEDAAGSRTAVHQDDRHRSRVRRCINKREAYLT